MGEILSTLGLGNKGGIQPWAARHFLRKKEVTWLTLLFAGLIIGKYDKSSTPLNFQKWGLLVFLQSKFQTLFHIYYFSFLFAYYCFQMIQVTFKMWLVNFLWRLSYCSVSRTGEFFKVLFLFLESHCSISIEIILGSIYESVIMCNL